MHLLSLSISTGPLYLTNKHSFYQVICLERLQKIKIKGNVELSLFMLLPHSISLSYVRES